MPCIQKLTQLYPNCEAGPVKGLSSPNPPFSYNSWTIPPGYTVSPTPAKREDMVRLFCRDATRWWCSPWWLPSCKPPGQLSLLCIISWEGRVSIIITPWLVLRWLCLHRFQSTPRSPSLKALLPTHARSASAKPRNEAVKLLGGHPLLLLSRQCPQGGGPCPPSRLDTCRVGAGGQDGLENGALTSSRETIQTCPLEPQQRKATHLWEK